MIELKNHPDFKEIEYNNKELKLLLLNNKQLVFFNLPESVYEDFKENGFEYSFLQDKIIFELGYKLIRDNTLGGAMYQRI